MNAILERSREVKRQLGSVETSAGTDVCVQLRVQLDRLRDSGRKGFKGCLLRGTDWKFEIVIGEVMQYILSFSDDPDKVDLGNFQELLN